jgi:hypothetical protein
MIFLRLFADELCERGHVVSATVVALISLVALLVGSGTRAGESRTAKHLAKHSIILMDMLFHLSTASFFLFVVFVV